MFNFHPLGGEEYKPHIEVLKYDKEHVNIIVCLPSMNVYRKIVGLFILKEDGTACTATWLESDNR